MATPASTAGPVGPESLVTVKVLYNESTRRFKIPLKDLGARVFPQKLRQLLGIPSDINVIFERYSDSAASYVYLDSENVAVYKQLYRAAKAKLKLRIRAIVVNLPRVTSSPAATSSVVPQFPTLESPAGKKSPGEYSLLGITGGSPRPASLPEHPVSPPHLSIDTNKAIAQWPHNDVVPPPPSYRESIPRANDASLPVISHTSPSGTFCINCDNCGRSIPDEHYHCSICQDGDYDLCTECVEAGVSCPAECHWLIKRSVKDGVVINSTTVTVAPRMSQTKVQDETKTPEPCSDPASGKMPELPSVPASNVGQTTCNGCLKVHSAMKMVACNDCESYHLCLACLLKDKHGHHPAHTFTLVHDRQFCLKSLVLSRCKPGRHHQHAAICDGCDKRIIGVRHKCLTCPDWDYCVECVSNAPQAHPGHRFAPIYEAIAEPPQHPEVHYGIFCDGPLCKDNVLPRYITGTRYKCAVCHDVDFCAKCEALPSNTHNRTHPLIKLNTPVRNVSVSTISDDGLGRHLTLGDRVHKATSTEATAGSAEMREDEVDDTHREEPDAGKVLDRASSPPTEELGEASPPPYMSQEGHCHAVFVRDTVPDGTKLPPNEVFQQTWTLHNPGPVAWPAGCAVRFVGGDSMFNVDTDQPSSMGSIKAAMESNTLPSVVEQGQSANFTVTMRTPNREGTSISYWRLKHPDGAPFGDRLWCEVQVRADAEPIKKEADEKEEEKEKKAMVDATPEAPQPEEKNGAMIFPLLEKESPATSTHEAMIPEPPAPTVSSVSEKDVLEDVENLTLDDAVSEDGFFTDDEYDILDASDREFLDAHQAQE